MRALLSHWLSFLTGVVSDDNICSLKGIHNEIACPTTWATLSTRVHNHSQSVLSTARKMLATVKVFAIPET